MIPLFKPYVPEYLPELEAILHSNSLSYGKWGILFESMLGNYIGNSNIAVVNSFNAAMLVTLTTLDIKAGDEIIASPMSCLASNQPFVTIGAKVIWADIDPDTGTLNPESVKRKISNKTKAIFHNHFCGYPGYVDEINQIGNNYNIYVVDDAIEAFGSEYKGNLMGNVGTDATVFSFQTVRLPNAIEGGAVIFNNSVLFEKAKRIRDYGINRKLFRDAEGEINVNFDISEPGFGALLNEVNSYIGSVQMKSIKDLLTHQRNNAMKWQSTLKAEYPLATVLNKDFHLPNYWVFGLLTSSKVETLIKFRDLGYNVSSVHLPNNNYSVFGAQELLPGVEDFYSKFLALPCGWWFNK